MHPAGAKTPARENVNGYAVGAFCVYPAGDQAFEFQRVVSRLAEMRFARMAGGRRGRYLKSEKL